MMRTRLPRAGLVLLLATSGCTVGPNFQAPKWVTAPASWITGHHAHRATVRSEPVNAPMDAAWWSIFHDPKLTALEMRVASSNLDVQAAAYRVLESRAQLGVTGATLYPVFNANASGQKLKASNRGVFSAIGAGAAGSPNSTTATEANGASSSLGAGGIAVGNISPINIYQYGFDASWELDLWGKNQRAIEAARASSAAAEWARRGALLSALSEVARDYINLRGTQDQLSIARRNVHTAEQGLKLTRERAQAGVTTDLDVANAAAQVRTTQAQIPTLEAQER